MTRGLQAEPETSAEHEKTNAIIWKSEPACVRDSPIWCLQVFFHKAPQSCDCFLTLFKHGRVNANDRVPSNADTSNADTPFTPCMTFATSLSYGHAAAAHAAGQQQQLGVHLYWLQRFFHVDRNPSDSVPDQG